MTAALLPFPDGFVWGTGNSSHQVEGNNRNNQWFRFEQSPGAIVRGDVSGRACDWWGDGATTDLDAAAALGLNAHRISLEWSRIEPVPGQFDSAALDHYRRLLGTMIERGITPWVALHHFTNPLWFETGGGWERADAAARFANYATVTMQALGDLCTHWLTMNEPMVYLGQSWVRGIWPPQRRNPSVARRVFLHLLNAHAAAYHTIKRRWPGAQVSVAKSLRGFHPARSKHPGDWTAAQLRSFLFEDLWLNAVNNGRLLPPLGVGQRVGRLANTMDFVAVNYYCRQPIRAVPIPGALFGEEQIPIGAETSDCGSNGPYSYLDPDGLYTIVRAMQAYGKPIYVTENGLPDATDVRRARWIVLHLAALHRAIQVGCDIRGYFHWTLVDNFEWNEGWTLRFGLIELDPATQARRMRPSAHTYGEIIRSNGLTELMLAAYAAPYPTASLGE